MDPTCDSHAGGLRNSLFETPWLAAYTRPRFESKVKQYCEQRGIRVFLPTHRSWRNWSDRKKLLDLPLFPSYLFMRVNAEERQQAVRAPGLLWFVHNHLGPVRVSAMELKAIQQVLASGLKFDPLPNVQLGDEVEVIAGSLRGWRGRLLCKDSGSLAIMVTAINGGVRVRLPDPGWLRRSAPAPLPALTHSLQATV